MGIADRGQHSFTGLFTGGNIIWFMFSEFILYRESENSKHKN
jgi:hypothetical protein